MFVTFLFELFKQCLMIIVVRMYYNTPFTKELDSNLIRGQRRLINLYDFLVQKIT